MAIVEPVTLDSKLATVVVTPVLDGWTIVGVSKIRSWHGQAATLTAQIPSCGCGGQSCRFGWHEERMLSLAKKISKSYL